MTTLYIRADASKFIGAGHIMRTLILAQKLGAAGWDCTFATRRPTIDMMPNFIDSSGIIEINDAEPEPAQLISSRPQGVDWLLVDHYGWDEQQEYECRSWADRIMIIDDLANRRHDADLLLDQTLSRNPSEYRLLVPKSCDMLLGPDYALLRDQFVLSRVNSLKKRKSDHSRLERVLINFGMGDPGSLVKIALEGIRQSGLTLSVDVVPGSGSTQDSEIRNLIGTSHCSVQIHGHVNEMAKLMKDADLAIGAAGTSSWERCCIGLPSIITVVADNQKRIGWALERQGAAILIDKAEICAERYAQLLVDLAKHPQTLHRMSQKASAICDGRGADRVIDVLQGYD